MKKFVLFLTVAAAALAASCQKPVEPAVTLTSSPTAVVPTEGDVVSITFTSNVAWTAKSDQSWLTVSPASGEAGENITIKASALKNDTNDPREATVTITAGTASTSMKVTQSQLDALNIATTEFTVEAAGGNVEIPVSSNVDYEVVVPEAVDWVHVTSTRGLVDTKITLKVDETKEYKAGDDGSINPETIVRSANVTVRSGNLSSVVKVSQKTFVPYFDFDGDYSAIQYGGRMTVPQEGGTFTVNVVTNLSWRAHYDEEWPPEDTSWLEFKQEENAIVITVQPNEGFIARDNWIYVNAAQDLYGDVFGGYFQVYQEPVPAPVTPQLVWNAFVPEQVTLGYNRLAFSQSGALLISDGEKVHAINPANGEYWKALSWPGITPTSIDVDDAGHVIIASDVEAAMDWDAGVLISGTELKVYYATDVNETPKEIILPNSIYGTVGGFRARGDLATKGAITGVVGGASYWFGYDIADFKAQANYYGTQNSGAGPGANTFWSPETGAAVSVGPDLHDGVLFRAYDGNESVYYRKDAYTPKWAADMAGIEYEPWTLVTTAGSGGNENQNNMDIIDFEGKKIIAFTQGYHFTWAGFNADIYVVDVTDPKAPQVLATVKTADWILSEWPNGQNSADVLLRAGDGVIELYAIHSGLGTLAKFIFKP